MAKRKGGKWAWAAIQGTELKRGGGTQLRRVSGCARSHADAKKLAKKNMRRVGIFGSCGFVHEGSTCAEATKFAKAGLTVCSTARIHSNAKRANTLRVKLMKQTKGLKMGMFWV